uniref:Uncharacterized protein n=1 Tax=Aureococcus anophagefferens TaxID=44056 RepID=A0A649UBW1_AURAN|nr:hypothetical protein [Aureococcus anophagefferens]QQW50167.1 hypothetical protein [Aureococcus anophagefferens]QQW50210.1 hypothetical protein [Aureococcus anophagefferens]QQW50254.1 hypothetical protein [Aureococcus anophagefferens]QQW50298.1 hypothetical protein [Aureococcus anophagefferens]
MIELPHSLSFFSANLFCDLMFIPGFFIIFGGFVTAHFICCFRLKEISFFSSLVPLSSLLNKFILNCLQIERGFFSRFCSNFFFTFFFSIEISRGL